MTSSSRELRHAPSPPRRLPGILPLLAGAVLAACSPAPPPPDDAADPATPREPEHGFAPGAGISDEELDEFHVVLACEVAGEPVGELAFELWPDSAPVSVRRFLRHCDEGWYDGTPVNRIAREYVLQAGDPTGTGRGGSPYGELPAEVSLDPRHAHAYGVLALADPPSIQFYVCLAESTKVWALDHGSYNRLGRLAHGVETLELLANQQVGFAGEEKSMPVLDVRIAEARVVRGSPPRIEQIARPRPDLGDEPEIVSVRAILITFLERGQSLGVTRNRREAEERARECFDRLASGELDFDEARGIYSDEQYPADFIPPPWRISNYGVLDPGQRARQDAVRELNAYRSELRARAAGGEITLDEVTRLLEERSREVGAWVRETAMDRREEIEAPGFADVAFGLEIGEVGFVPFDPFDCYRGFYVVQRVE